MSAATAEAAPAQSQAAGGKKKLIIIIAVVLLLVLVGGGAAFFLLKKKHADGEEGEDGAHAEAKAKPKAEAQHAPPPKLRDPKNPPVFVPLEPFTVNLADRESDRYAQIGVTLEIEDAKFGDQMKQYMPAIRSNILIVLSAKTADQLLSREGKDKLARQILLASVQPLGYPVDFEEDEDEAADGEAPKKKKKKKPVMQSFPVLAVHFSTFIVQ